MSSAVLSVAPHPDDELLGAPATLMALRDAGWRVINLACSLGRTGDRERRRDELTNACQLAGFELVIPEAIPPIGRDDDLASAQRALSAAIGDAVEQFVPELITGPSPHDGHHGHEVVGRAIRDAVERRGEPRGVLFWGLWSDLPVPNLLTAFDAPRLAEIQRALREHAGEVERNRFDRVLESRAVTQAVLGSERIFGFGAHGAAHEYAELLTAVRWCPSGGWRLAAPTEFDPARPVPDGAGPDVGRWLHAPSVRTLMATSE